jgi:DNA-damage-inducible protein D
MDEQQPPQENSQELALPVEIRHQWHNDRWYYVVVDVIGYLTQSKYPNRYWSDLKRRSAKTEEFFELYALCVKLEIPGANNKMYLMECMDTDGIFRLVQSIPSETERVEHLKLWIAQSASIRMETLGRTGIDLDAERRKYRRMGYDEDWIEKRIQSILVRNELTAEWDQRGAEKKDYPVLTNDIAVGTFDKTSRQHLEFKGLKKGNLRDHMTPMEVIFQMLGDQTSTELHRERDSQGVPQLRRDAKEGGRIAGQARELVEKQLGMKITSPIDYQAQVKATNQPSLLEEAGQDDESIQTQDENP